MGKSLKYSREVLERLVQESETVSEVMRKLGLVMAGGTHSHLTRSIKNFDIDTSHFTGRASNRGKPNNSRLSWDSILVKNRLDGRKENVGKLKRALLEFGTLELCTECGIGPVWNGQKLVLQIDHKNGDNLDNTPSNLRFLCPNCHSQTPTFGAKNIGRNPI